MHDSELQKKHFDTLKEKYQVGHYRGTVSDSFLYLILRKANLDIQVTDLEFQWLTENHLVKTAEIISLQRYQLEDKQRLETELLQLRSRYHLPEELKLPIDSPICSMLWKLDSGHVLRDSELDFLNQYGLVNRNTLLWNTITFLRLKLKYKAKQHKGSLPEEPLYSILQKLDTRTELSESEADWLLKHNFDTTLEIYWQQVDERKAELEFSELKTKYKIDSHLFTSIHSLLFSILKQLDAGGELKPHECEWLKNQNLNDLIEIDQRRKDKKLFKKLKGKYKVKGYSSDSSHYLFIVLKNLEASEAKTFNGADVEFQALENAIQWLLNEGLVETAEIAKQIHFKRLKAKYQIVGQLTLEPFYEIMLKLEREERLDPQQVIQLMEKERLSRDGKIAIAYYRLEAIFYEEEYRRTGNKWNLPSASSNWRKADKPGKALKVTENVNWNKVQESELKSALLVTRGAAFRDLGQLDEAENCAKRAKDCCPEAHQPYTLLGAICYDRYKFLDGDKWFEQAVERGANDIDDEIRRLVRRTKDRDKRRAAAEYLLSKDPICYAWANSYLK